MKKLPTLAEYQEQLIDDVRNILLHDQKEYSRELTYKLLGIGYKFGDIIITQERLENVKKLIDPTLIAGAEQKIANEVSKQLLNLKVSGKINIIIDNLLNDLYKKISNEIFAHMYDIMMTEMKEKINAEMTSWLVAEKFVK